MQFYDRVYLSRVNIKKNAMFTMQNSLYSIVRKMARCSVVSTKEIKNKNIPRTQLGYLNWIHTKLVFCTFYFFAKRFSHFSLPSRLEHEVCKTDFPLYLLLDNCILTHQSTYFWSRINHAYYKAHTVIYQFRWNQYL